MAKNSNLHNARVAKNDEFYTRLQDIEDELYHYWYCMPETFKDKVVLCNCDNPSQSNFWVYFHKRYKELGLAGLIATHYSVSEQVYVKTYTGGDDNNVEAGVVAYLQGDGDFRSDECIEILKMADIVVTNPPFSLFREYILQLMKYNKKFIILGNINAVTYKEVFSYIKENDLWLGARPLNKDMYFDVPEEYRNYLVENKKEGSAYKIVDGVVRGRLANVCWFTNIDIPRRHECLITGSFYKGNEEEYPKYDNYDAINVDKVMDIPGDHDGVMGVPITFLGKYNPEQFEILGVTEYWDESDIMKEIKISDTPRYGSFINGKELYKRLLIKALSYTEEE